MNDEIKEINLPKEIEEAFNCIDYELSVCNDELPKILYYITNLQEELNIMVKDDERSQETIIRLTKENERLKEENKHIFGNVNDDELLISNAMNYAEAQDYKSRCEKAIEYINKFWKEKSYYESIENCLRFADMNEFEYEDMLNILQNGSEENERDL